MIMETETLELAAEGALELAAEETEEGYLKYLSYAWRP
jgi:hypothetical protein